MPNVYIIAGPNGAGKTTFAREFLPQYAKCTNFVNADLIAQGLAPLRPEAAAIRAGRLVLDEIQSYASQLTDFAFETTLSGKTYVKVVEQLRAKGYKIHFFYLWVPTAQVALSRVKMRVSEGGHHVPAKDVRRRFRRSLENFLAHYRHLADSWMFFDNSEPQPRTIAVERQGEVDIIDKRQFDRLIGLYEHAQKYSKDARRRSDRPPRGGQESNS